MPIKTSHFKAVLFRKYIMIKRSWRSFIFTIVACIVASALAIAIYYAMAYFMQPGTNKITFEDFAQNSNFLLFVDDGSLPEFPYLKQSLINLYERELGQTPDSLTFNSSDELNSWVVQQETSLQQPTYIPMGVQFYQTQNNAFAMSTWFNTSGYHETSDQFTVDFLATKAVWNYIYGGNFTLTFTVSASRSIEYYFGNIGPIILVAGLYSIIPLIITQPIIDITGEIRSYMVSCTLKIFPYWLGTFLLDFIVWIFTTTIIWAIFCIAQIQAFLDNLLTTWYTMVMLGPSFIIFMYVISFLFDSPESANRQCFLTFIIVLLVPYVIQCVRWKPNPVWLEWIYSLIPPLSLQRIFSYVLSNIGPLRQSFSYYWKEATSQSFLIMDFGNILIYSFILFIIESVRNSIKRKLAKNSFNNYNEYFQELKDKQEITPDVLEMRERVENSHDFAVRIDNVSRLFFNTEGKPIPAVNHVSLGIDKGCLFGFLGANGAGKTTLIRMITSLLPPSDGTIEINGVDISKFHDPTIISVCPQFNNHLCNEMTPAEHFKLYGMLFEFDKEEEEKSIRLIHDLELEELKDKPLQDLSQGDVRKLAVALSFYSRANIILLDEPTASLDPVARHNVQELILEYKSDKTFMLCTHLLSEAEFLCDIISIMVKGSVYAIGTPQQLTERFGTIYKIDIMLRNDSDEEAEKCTNFIEKTLPTAKMEISRPAARLYDVPATDIELAELFALMENGMNGDNGYCYYTCSSSSLEHVFMEILKMSETDEEL
ncbi:ABC transporter family protein [Histomonas meleagridis]|uniref:ABC transporter family protein n=1 Tax=Histomonas meleagridis TaxID=135588 RepID=UPI0035593DB3|nr:ABC transporter family protein [Histomonas meleagridis]KAH0804304.1 ABC transporter family protein [Histomonas meleagridis]